jgi:hypothetical protein
MRAERVISDYRAYRSLFVPRGLVDFLVARLGGQLRIETRETVAKFLLHVDVNEVESATEKVLADPGASAVIANPDDSRGRMAGAGRRLSR